MRKYRFFSTGKVMRIGRKNRQVSVRLSQDVYDFINHYDGKNFSDKLDNLVFDMMNIQQAERI